MSNPNKQLNHPAWYERPPLRVMAAVVVGIIAVGSAFYFISPRSSAKPNQLAVQQELLKGQWSYLPGATAEGKSLKINDLGFKIVEQDGSGGQSNPPINLDGTSLKVDGPFEIASHMEDIEGQAVLQLYGRVPNIQDEFRVEHESLSLTVDPVKDKIDARIWAGASNLSSPKPMLEKTFETRLDNQVNLSLVRRAGKLTINVNGKILGSLPEKGIFNSRRVWFGADSHGGNWKLTSLTAQSLKGGRGQVVDTSKTTIKTDENGLQGLASRKRPDFKVGAAMALAPMASDTQYQQISLGGNFGAMTIENASKWQFTEPQPGKYDFAEADALVDLAHRHNLVVNGHAIVFGEALPGWVRNLPSKTPAQKALVKKVFLDHVSTEAIHFKGKVASWDIDEVFADYDQFQPSKGQIFRKNLWLEAMGPDYIPLAIETIHQVDPNSLIRINDYGLEANGDRWNTVSKYLLNDLIPEFERSGVPADKIAVGFESHVYEPGDEINPSTINSHINWLAKLRIKSAITEMDVYRDDQSKVQSDQYLGIFKACFTNPNCTSFTTWGVSDRYDLWQDENHKLHYGQDFLWDKGMRPTEAQQAIAGYLKK